MVGQRCARAGCRAWARRDGAYCQAHGQQVSRAAATEPAATGAEPAPAGLARVQGQWAVRQLAEFEDLIRRLMTDDSAESLANEISVSRLVLARLLYEEGDAGRLADGVARVVGVLLKVVELERAKAEPSESLTSAATRILTELGGDKTGA